MMLRATTLLCCACATSRAWMMPAVAPPPIAASARASSLRMYEAGIEGVEKLPLMMPKQKTWMPKKEDMLLANKKWYVVDAEGLRLGRMASEIAKILLGKHKPTYTPGALTGDCVIVVNAEKVIVTGDKYNQKLYRRHSGRPGGMTTENFSELQARIPERIVEKAIKGMLPKNSHGRQLFRHLKVYTGAKHPHDAQTPEVSPGPSHPRHACRPAESQPAFPYPRRSSSSAGSPRPRIRGSWSSRIPTR